MSLVPSGRAVRRDAASSVAPVPSGYERSLRPCLALAHRTPTTKRHPEMSSDKRYLVLAEDYSGDPHYGKTARGIIHCGLTPVVALLDSTRAGEVQDGIPI